MIEASNRILAMQKPLVPKAVPFEAPPASVEAQAPEWVDPDKATSAKEFKLFGNDGFTFLDALDIINPLQHIPVISTIYRRITGDEISPGARIAGDTLFGGPIGAAIAMADTAVEYKTGHDMGANALAMLIGDDKPDTPATTAVAQATPPAITNGSVVSGFAGSALPDLGALGNFTTAAGSANPIQLEASTTIEPWQDPDKMALPKTAKQSPLLLPIHPSQIAAAQVEAAKIETAQAETIQAETAATGVPAIGSFLPRSAPQADMSAPKPATPNNAANNTGERPMPTDAAKAQAINALAQMPTSATTAAVAQLASTDPHQISRPHMTPPAGDIPRGAASSLSRSASRAYANSMAQAEKAEGKSEAAAPANANTNPATAVNEAARSATNAQNDWIVDAMQNAMVKYEASARLKTANANAPDTADGQAATNPAGVNPGGIAISR